MSHYSFHLFLENINIKKPLNIGYQQLAIGCYILGITYWVLLIGYYLLGITYWLLEYWVLLIDC